MGQFDHRFGDYRDKPEGSESTALPDVPLQRLEDPSYCVLSRYWVADQEVDGVLADNWDRGWLLGWRDICRSTDERTVISSLIPRTAVGDKFLLVLPAVSPELTCALAANLNSFVLDFAARQKLGGTSLKYFTMKQLPLLPPGAYQSDGSWFGVPKLSFWIAARVTELIFTC